MIRAWLIVGPASMAYTLLPSFMSRGFWAGTPPSAADYRPGEYIAWQWAASEPILLVCVELPVS